MKRVVFPLLLSFLWTLFLSGASFAGEGRSVTLLFTGSVKGSIEPCRT